MAKREACFIRNRLTADAVRQKIFAESQGD